jgi:hypothetical protein
MNYLMAQTLNNKMMYNGIKAGDTVSEKDKCYYCEEEGTYWDQIGATFISVCKKHMVNYYSS